LRRAATKPLSIPPTEAPRAPSSRNRKPPNNRQRGKRGEREAAAAVREHWNATSCIRAAQANGRYSADLLNCDPHGRLHVEVKLRRKIAASLFLDQAIRDCTDAVPVVLMRQDGGEWLVMFRCCDTSRFLNALRQQIPTP
jgi:Holliday junction resolvase